MYRIGVDLGGTNIVAGVINEKYEIIGSGKMKTNAPRPAAEILKDIINLFVEFQDAREYEDKIEQNRLESLESRLSKQDERMRLMAKNILGQE